MPFDKYNVGCYLIDRLIEAGCDHLFGVPGDFNLRFLDDVMAHPTLKWVGNANELNAAYMADGYARQRGFGALTTTYGVGELSALNGVAGSAAERVPVLHIAGATSTKSQGNSELLHHTLGDGDHHHFLRISKEVCCVAVMLTPDNCLTEIDRVITEVLYQKKPGYIALPVNITEMVVKPPAAKLVPRKPELSDSSRYAFMQAVNKRLSVASHPAILVGHLVHRFGCAKQLNRVLEQVHIPFSVACYGKGAVNEHLENFVGTYIAVNSIPCPAKTVVDGADVCISIGVQLCDTVTAGFTQKLDPLRTIDIQPFFSKVGDEIFQQIPMEVAIKAVEECVLAFNSCWRAEYPEPESYKFPESDQELDLTHVWREIQESLRPNDIIAIDLGTSAFSSTLLRLPEGADVLCQNMWASIGYSLPAAIGAQIANPSRRVICIIGDGAAQMTIQEIGTAAREGLHPTFLIINNSGYTIERHIRGWDALYNDIAEWDWTGLAKAFCKGNGAETAIISSVGEVRRILSKPSGTSVVVAEVKVDKYQGPLRPPVPLPGKPAPMH